MRILLVLCSLAAGCRSADPKATPGDFAFEYNWIAGTMPPPHHYEYTITVGPSGAGTIRFHPDYPSHKSPVWTEKFEVPRERLDAAYREMKEAGVFDKDWREQTDPPVGGNYSWLQATANGRTVKPPAFPADPGRLPEIYKTVNGLVPQKVWDDLNARREKFVQDYKK